GVVAPSCKSQLSIVLKSFPVVPVVVLNTINPSTVVVLTPFTTLYSIVLFVASLMYSKVNPLVLVLAIVMLFGFVVPPCLPSKINRSAPFTLIIEEVLDPVMEGVTPAAGRTVTLYGPPE